MYLPSTFALVGAALSSLAAAATCSNSATDRSCWGEYDINTNYYETVPDTGVVREYWLDIRNETVYADGRARVGLTVNGSIPGPTLFADWGDTVVVHVTNHLENNGTSMHWHGIRQLNNVANDGVSSVTTCPTAPGSTTTYTWKAEQYGSSWYHSHWYVQAWDGVFGGIQIQGPASADYDEDMGNLFLNDWDIATADQILVTTASTGRPTLQTGLINGTNVYTDSTTGLTTGYRHNNTVAATKRYRLRLVNAASDTHFKFSIDNHTLEVIATDFVPITPYTTDAVSIGMGQRYDVIITTDQTPSNYWMRAIAQVACSNNDNPDNIAGIWNYENVTLAEPTTTASANASDSAVCEDEPAASLVPVVSLNVGTEYYAETDFLAATTDTTIVEWEMGPTPYYNQWNYPTLMQVLDGNDTWTDVQNIQAFPEANTWGIWVISIVKNSAHPIHMHGHDFYVLGTGSGTFDANTTTLQLSNPPRRDTVTLPAQGWVVIAFITDNPGTWLVHCHVAWHASQGFAVQILERESEITGTVSDRSYVDETCAAWGDYEAAIPQTDSGI